MKSLSWGRFNGFDNPCNPEIIESPFFEVKTFNPQSAGDCHEYEFLYSNQPIFRWYSLLTFFYTDKNIRSAINYKSTCPENGPQNLERKKVKPDAGLEPATVGLKVQRSTDWANQAPIHCHHIPVFEKYHLEKPIAIKIETGIHWPWTVQTFPEAVGMVRGTHIKSSF